MYDVTVYGQDVGNFSSCAWPKIEALENETSVDTLLDTVIFEPLRNAVSVRPHN